jgi:hypothetical protein
MSVTFRRFWNAVVTLRMHIRKVKDAPDHIEGVSWASIIPGKAVPQHPLFAVLSRTYEESGKMVKIRRAESNAEVNEGAAR